ncbi:MAG TPA: hypothetical protein PKE69_17450 [Pyrinomonadaceae bacterium]|nr:hypothetical protein [Pyrinomonadaceae bacterium]
MRKKIDWIALSKQVGTDGGVLESVGTQDAQRAIEILIGEENLREAVDYYIDGKPGSELVRFVLRQFHPWSAMEYCYQIYKSDENPERRMFAVELLRAVADKRALMWIYEFLADNNPQIQVLGIGILDYLNLKNLIVIEDVEEILIKAAKHSNKSVRQLAKELRKQINY